MTDILGPTDDVPADDRNPATCFAPQSITSRPSNVSISSINNNNNSNVPVIPPLPPAASLKETIHPPPPPAKRLYRIAENKWVTRDIAALDFLLNIPLQAEPQIVQNGYSQQIKQEEEYESNSDSETLNTNTTNNKKKKHYNAQTNPRHASRQQHHHHHLLLADNVQGRWWEKWITSPSSSLAANHMTNNHRTISSSNNAHHNSLLFSDLVLEQPTLQDQQRNNTKVRSTGYAPGRRLEGDDAIKIQIPLATNTMTKQRSIARIAALREWELQTAHGIPKTSLITTTSNSSTLSSSLLNKPPQPQPPLLDGRLFFSASGSYPVSVFSIIRYEPKREEAQLRRLKLEARGGGGSQFRIPARDWRGISYRSLLPRREEDADHFAFNRFLRKQHDNNKDDKNAGDDNMDDNSSQSSEDSNVYVPGILDDPDMVLGRHRNVMVGDRVIGPMIASTIQFVAPDLLKAELNKQFRERFDGWEPSKSALKYIGARVINGNYVLTEPVLEQDDEDDIISKQEVSTATAATPAVPAASKIRKRQSSTTSSVESSELTNEGLSEKQQTTEKQVRMPPSLTLSKIRSLKHQSLQVALKANFEIGTLSLACVYFERLCLDCRVDKSNRRLTFAACLLLASKLNEPNVALVTQKVGKGNSGGGDVTSNKLSSFARPNTRSNTMFASLLEFFTQEWEIGLKQLFDAEWGVFAALGFSLHVSPSQVAFHFKRFMKTLEWSPKNYLGKEMYEYWQESLAQEEDRRLTRELRKERLQHRKEEELLNLHIEIENDLLRRKNKSESDSDIPSELSDHRHDQGDDTVKIDNNELTSPHKAALRKTTGINFFQRLGMRRITSAERLTSGQLEHMHLLPVYKIPPTIPDPPSGTLKIPHSTSLPILAGMSETAEAAMDNEQDDDDAQVDLEVGISETYSIDSVAGSFRDTDDAPPV